MTDNPTPDYKPGDVVNGHRLEQAEDGSMTWVPVAPDPAAGIPKRKWYTRKAIIIPAAVILGLIVISSLARAGNRGDVESAEPDVKKPAVVEVAEPAEPAEQVEVPDVVGLTAGEAYAALVALGFESAAGDDISLVVASTDPASGELVDEGSTVTLTVIEKPALTIEQENAIEQAESYLRHMAFSRKGLIDQLVYEGYDEVTAKFAIKYISPDWNAQAAAKAQSYLDTMSFSKKGLYDQLEYEGFTDEQIKFGLKAVGY